MRIMHLSLARSSSATTKNLRYLPYYYHNAFVSPKEPFYLVQQLYNDAVALVRMILSSRCWLFSGSEDMTFPFLDLPAEIRNVVLRLLLTHNASILARSCNNLKPPRPVSLGLTSSLCLVSRAVYAEAISILYGENTFQAHPTFLTASVFAMDPERPVSSLRCLSHIRKWHVRVRLDCDPYYEPAIIAQMFTDAHELEIEIFRASWGIGSYDPLEGFTRIRGVKKARVHGSLGKRYASWLESIITKSEGTEVESWNEGNT